jgi:DNA-binding transcriptional regulator YbjK
MARSAGDRARLVADAAISVLAERGMRGLTHRAVDEAAGLPPGSTSYYARTRAALLAAAVRRLAERDQSGTDDLMAGRDRLHDPAVLAAVITEVLDQWRTTGRERMLARYELALEANRRPELRSALTEGGRRFREGAAMLLAAAGSADPERHARTLVAWCDGLLFDTLAGAGAADPPTSADIRASLGELLHGMLPAAPEGSRRSKSRQ